MFDNSLARVSLIFLAPRAVDLFVAPNRTTSFSLLTYKIKRPVKLVKRTKYVECD